MEINRLVLITGIAGFIGSSLAIKLLEEDTINNITRISLYTNAKIKTLSIENNSSS